MQWHKTWMITALVLGALTALPAAGEQLKYYVWTDDNGVVHLEDTPPKDRDYETRIIEVDENVVPSPGVAAGAERSSSGSEDGGRSRSAPAAGDGTASGEVDAAVAEEEQRRLDNGSGPASGGAETAPGAEPAASGAAASGSGAASGSVTAPGAPTAPSASLPPVSGP